jgi:hypothetical protein
LSAQFGKKRGMIENERDDASLPTATIVRDRRIEGRLGHQS